MRRSSATIARGKVIVLVFSVLAAGMPALHLKGTRIGEIGRGDGGQ